MSWTFSTEDIQGFFYVILKAWERLLSTEAVGFENFWSFMLSPLLKLTFLSDYS